MTDIFSKSKRTEIMKKIKSEGTGLEKQMKIILHQEKLKYRSQPNFFGKPDFIIENRILLFCDSSFWHGKNWHKLRSRLEKGNNPEYWISHIEKNKERDKLVTKKLRKQGHTVLRLWDEDIFKRPELCIEKIKFNLSV